MTQVMGVATQAFLEFGSTLRVYLPIDGHTRVRIRITKTPSGHDIFQVCKQTSSKESPEPGPNEEDWREDAKTLELSRSDSHMQLVLLLNSFMKDEELSARIADFLLWHLSNKTVAIKLPNLMR